MKSDAENLCGKGRKTENAPFTTTSDNRKMKLQIFRYTTQNVFTEEDMQKQAEAN